MPAGGSSGGRSPPRSASRPPATSPTSSDEGSTGRPSSAWRRPAARGDRTPLPDELAALHGMADGAGLTLVECSSPTRTRSSIATSAGRARRDGGGRRDRPDRGRALLGADRGRAGDTLLGHDEQWLAAEPGEIVLIVEVPDDPGGAGRRARRPPRPSGRRWG